MNLSKIEKSFHEKICEQIQLLSEGTERFRVLTPFRLDDGDHLSIVMKRENGQWLFSDEGHTYMHLSYDLDESDLQKGTRQTIISNTLSIYSLEDRSGEILTFVNDDKYGESLYSLLQALLKISDVTYLSRERVKSSFFEDFKHFIEEAIPKERYELNWHDSKKDPDAKYTVDCRINGRKKPYFVFALSNNDKVRDATIALLKFEQWGIPFQSIGIFQNQEEINRKVLARLSDVCDKQFSSLNANRDRIQKWMV